MTGSKEASQKGVSVSIIYLFFFKDMSPTHSANTFVETRKNKVTGLL